MKEFHPTVFFATLAAVAMLLIVPGPALAGQAEATLVGGKLTFKGGSEKNRVAITYVPFDYDAPTYTVEDSGAVLDAGTGCKPVTSSEVHCDFNGYDVPMKVDLGAGNDKLYLRTGDGNAAKVKGGKGDDWLDGSEAGDKLDGGSGNDQLSGALGSDTLLGGPGADAINADDGVRDNVNCGAGRGDLTLVDAKDKVKGCEKITR